MQAEYKKASVSPGFKVPPEIDGVPHERFPEILHSLAKDSMHNAGYWFISSGVVALWGGAMLVLVHRAQRSKSA